MKASVVLKRAESVLRIEADGHSVHDRTLGRKLRACGRSCCANCHGKVVVTGLGKSGLICRKIAATLASTGTPAFFLHSGDGIHGDLGMVMQGDVVLAVSNSGETEEILKLLPHFKLHGIKLIVMTGNPESSLARAGDVVLNVRVKEACPLGIGSHREYDGGVGDGRCPGGCFARTEGIQRRRLCGATSRRHLGPQTDSYGSRT